MISRERLKHRNRIGKRMIKRFYVWGWDGMDMEEEANTPSLVGYLGNTKVSCSCWMCGNPRRKFKGKERLTLQERRHQEAWQEEVTLSDHLK